MRVLEVKGNTEENSGRWKGHITASIAVPLDRTWQVGSDFSGLHKFVPIVEVCERLKGCNRIPGCLRFYTISSATGLPGGKRKAWAKDRLLNVDEETHSYTYAVEGSNMNLENCQITFNASDGKDGTTIVTWAWELDPIKKSTREKTLSDMAEFGCTFIKGLEAAVATTDSIDFNFEGAPPDIIQTLRDGDGGIPYDPPAPALSVMKSRLDTLSKTLNKISQKLEEGPIPADLYRNELESLQSTLADGRRSLVNHLHGYMSDTRLGQSNKSFGTSDLAKRYEDCPLLSDKIISQSNIGNSKSGNGHEECYLLSSEQMISPQPDSEACHRKRVDALPEKGKGRSTRDGECRPCPAKFPKLALEEDLRVEMDNASRCAYEAFQDFSNQFQSDLRDDISQKLESVELRLEALGLQKQEAIVSGVKDGTLNIHPDSESQGENYGLGAGPGEGHDSAHTLMQECSPVTKWPTSPSSNGDKWLSSPSSNGDKWPSSPSSDGAKWPSSPSSHDAKMTPSPGCQTLEDDRGQFGVWELDAARSQRLPGSPLGMHSVRSRSGLVFQDLLQMEMSQDTDQRSNEARGSPGILQPTHSIPEVRLRNGSSPCCQTSCFRGQKSPPSQSPSRERDVPNEYHSQPQGSESGRINEAYLNELKTGGHDQGLKMDHQTSEMRRTLGPEGHKASLITIMPEDSRQDSASKEAVQGSQQLQDQGWKHGGTKRQTAQNFEADLSRLQIIENNKTAESRPPESRDEEFRRHNPLCRPIRLPADIWPDFLQGESAGQRYLAERGQVEDTPKKGQLEDFSKKGHEEDNLRRECSGDDCRSFGLRRKDFHSSPTTQEKRDKVGKSTSSSPTQSLETDQKILQFKSKSLPAVDHMIAGSSMLNLDKIPFKLGVERATSFPVSGSSPSGPLDRSSDCPLSAAHSFGQCSKRVTLDLRNEIAPGVFHCHQGNQTRVVVDVPDDIETREEIRRHMHSLHRKNEIYKEFKRLGIQKPPTEQEILEDFAGARFQKQQELLALSETQTPVNDSSVYQPYYVDGKVWIPDAGHSPTVFGKSRLEQGHAYTFDPTFRRFRAGHQIEAKSPSQDAGQSSETKQLNCMSIQPSPSNRIPERILQSEQQRNVTNSFQKDGRSMTSESLRGDTTARELAMCDCNKTSWGGLTGHQGSQPRAQTAEGSTYRHGPPPVQKRKILIKRHGQRAPPVQPSSSKGKKRNQTGFSSSTESSSHVTTASSGDNACPEHKSTGSGDSSHLKRVDETSSDFSTNPEIRVHSQPQLVKRRDTPAITASTFESRQSVVSPQSSSECSIAKIPSNFPQNAGDNILLKVIGNGPSSRQLSLDEVVNNMPLQSGSSDPLRTSGKLGSITGSGSSPEILAYSEAQLLKINTPANTASRTLESRQSIVSPHSLKSRNDCSMAEILSNFPRDAEDFLLLEIMRNKRSSPQLSLDEVVNNVPSESGSSEFDPFRTSGKLGSINGSGSNTSSGHSFSTQLIGHVPHFTPNEKPTSLTAAQSNPSIASSMYPDNLPEGQEGSSNAMESRHHEDCPFRQLKTKVDEVIQSSGSSSPSHVDGRPHEINVRVSWADQRSQCHASSSSRDEGSRETSPSWRNLAFSATVDGMPQASDDNSKQSDLDVILEEPGSLKFFYKGLTQGLERVDPEEIRPPISHEVYRQVDEKVQKTCRDAETQTDIPGEPEVTQRWSSQNFGTPRLSRAEELRTRQSTQSVNSMAILAEFTNGQSSNSQTLDDVAREVSQKRSSQTSPNPRLLGVEGLRPRQSSQMQDSMVNVAQFMDAQNSYSQMLDDVVGKTVESISSYKARKKQEADDLAFRTRQSAQMLNSMLNVREYTDDSRSYSAWLDGVAPLSVIQTPMKDSEIQTPMTDSEIQTPWNESESGVPREPRFCEDSAANFLGSVAMQILKEFDDSKKIEAGAQDQSQYPEEPWPRDASAATFLGALSKQIVQEYTDHASDGGPIEGQSEGPTEPRFREQSALNFLAALSEHVLPEFKNRRGSQERGLPGGGEPRFRENSAINFLSALREKIMQRKGQSSMSELTGSSDLSKTIPPRSSKVMKASKDQEYLVESLSYQFDPKNPRESVNSQTETEIQEYVDDNQNNQPDLDNQTYLTKGVNSQTRIKHQAYSDGNWSLQPNPKNQVSQTKGLNYRPESNGWVSPDEGLGYEPASSEGQGTPRENSSYQPNSEDQGLWGTGLSFQRILKQATLVENSSYPAGSEGQSSLGDALSEKPDLKGQSYPNEGSSFQPKSKGQGTLVENLSYQPNPEDQGFWDKGLSFQPESEGEGTRGDDLTYQPTLEGQAYPDLDLGCQPEPEGQGSLGYGLSEQPHKKGQSYPDEDSGYQPESEGQGSLGHSLSEQPSQGRAYPKERSSFQPESEGLGTPGDRSSYQPGPEDEFWEKGLSFQPESEGQDTPGENLSEQADFQGEASLDEGFNDQPNPEDEAYVDEVNDQFNPEGGADPNAGFNDQLNPEGEADPDEGSNEQPDREGEAYADEGWNYQPDAEGPAYSDESLDEQLEDQELETESGTTDHESQNQFPYGRNSQFQFRPRSSQRNSQLDEMLQDLHTTVSRSRQNSASNPGK